MKLRTMIAVGAIISMAIGFALAQIVNADAPAPGSSADPLVSKSYVDQAMQDRIDALEALVAELSVEAKALQVTLNDMQVKLNKTPTTPSTGSSGSSGTSTGGSGTSGTSTGGSGTSSGTTGGTSGTGTSGTATTPGTGSSVVGKTVYIKATNNYVNLRISPSTDNTSTVVKQVLKNEAMTVLEVQNSWYKIKLSDNTTGWIAGWLVETR